MYAAEGSGKELMVASVGDKGRAQLQRAMPEVLKLCIADTYKAKVTFSQVSLILQQ